MTGNYHQFDTEWDDEKSICEIRSWMDHLSNWYFNWKSDRL